MKKGATHVDWAISMGIFLVYIMLTFIFLKPGSQPTYNEDTLLDIVYSGLEKDTTYTLQKKYLIITPTSDIKEDERYFLRIRNLDQSGMDMDWVESDKAGENHLTLVNGSLDTPSCENLTDIFFDFVDENDPTRKILELGTYLKGGEANIFWFLYSEELDFCPHRRIVIYDGDFTDTKCVKRDLNGNKEYNCLLDSVEISPANPQDPTNFTYQFGIVESFTAFSEKKLNDLYDENYEDLKKTWGFPEDKNFNITIEKIS